MNRAEDEPWERAPPPPPPPPPDQAFSTQKYPEAYPTYQPDEGPFAPYTPAGMELPPPIKGMKSGGGPSSSMGDRQAHEGKWQDLWAAVLFLIHLIAVIVLAIILGKKGMDQADSNAANTTAVAANGLFSQNVKDYRIGQIAPPLAVAGVLGGVVAFVWLGLMSAFPRTLIKVSLWGTVLFLTILGLVMLSTNTNTGLLGLLFLFFALVQAIYAYMVRHRIPFAGCILAKVVSVIRRFGGTVVVSFLASILSAAWLGLWIFGAAGALTLTNSAIIIFALLLSLYWTMEVIRNVVHVTVSGTVATFYFQQLNMPPAPTRRALGRAMGKSFGSICFGSLIVAAIQTVRAVLRQARESGDNAILMCCLDCILSCIESIVQYLNKYAYVQVAIYGKSFVRAAKDTWDLFKSQGIQVLINDDLTSGVLTMGSLISGCLCAIMAGSWSIATGHKHVAGAIAIVGFFIGFLMTHLVMVVVESGVASYYVCYAEDPATLQRNDPEFYMKIQARHQELTLDPPMLSRQ